ELPAHELALGLLEVLAQLQQAQGEAARATAELLDDRGLELVLLPLGVGVLEGRGEAQDLSAAQRRDLAPDRHGRVAVGPRQLELAAPPQRPHERRVLAAFVAQTQGT